MSTFSPLITELVNALCCLPGVGPKTAQRMVFYLLERDRLGGQKVADLLHAALEKVGNCRICHNLAEQQICEICQDNRRETDLLCVVESPMDLAAIEQLNQYRGRYFVLHGKLSPIDGIGPDELGLDGFASLLNNQQVTEVILATNPTVEGEATAIYLQQIIKQQHPVIKITKIAHGVPMGGELEYIDGNTLIHALQQRVEVEIDNV